MDSTMITVVRTDRSPDEALRRAEHDAAEIAETLGGVAGNRSGSVSSPTHLFSALAGPEYEATVTVELVATSTP